MSSFKSSTVDTLSCPTDEIYVFLPEEYKTKYEAPARTKSHANRKGNFYKEKQASGQNPIEDAADEESPTELNKPTTIADKIQSLTHSRTEVSTQMREKLLQDIFLHYTATEISETSITEGQIDVISRALSEASSEKEHFFAFKTLLSIAILFIEDFGALVSTELYEIIKRDLKDLDSIPAAKRAYLAVGYFTLFLVFNDGSHVAAIDEEINSWLTLLETSANRVKSHSQEVSVVVAIINGLSILLSLISDSAELNENIEALIPSIILYLTDDNPRISIAAGTLIAQCFQLYEYEEGFDDDTPYFDKDELVAKLVSNTKESSKKVSKLDKKHIHVAFRDILTTVNNNLSITARADFKQSKAPQPLLGMVSLTKSRKLQLFNWGYLPRLNHLRWIFGSGLTTHVFNDRDLLAIIKEDSDGSDKKFNSTAEDTTETVVETKSPYASSLDKKKKDIAISKARLEKQHEHGLS